MAMAKDVILSEEERNEKRNNLAPFEDCSLILAKASRDITQEEFDAYLVKREKEIIRKK